MLQRVLRIILVCTICAIYADASAWERRDYDAAENLRILPKRVRRATKFAEGKDIQWPSNVIYYERFGIKDGALFIYASKLNWFLTSLIFIVEERMKQVEAAMRIWEKETCVRFRPLAIEERFRHPIVLEVQLSIYDR